MAKTCRSILSGALGYALRHDAVQFNAARGTTPLSAKPKRSPRALTDEERAAWLARLENDAVAMRKDLPDLCKVMLGLGVRVGEALALTWDEIDLDGVDLVVGGQQIRVATAKIEWTLVRVKGVGLVRKSAKTSAGARTSALSPSLTELLRRRKAGSVDSVDALRASAPTSSGGSVDFVDALAGARPVFPDALGGWRDPSNTRRDIRNVRGGEEFAWVTATPSARPRPAGWMRRGSRPGRSPTSSATPGRP